MHCNLRPPQPRQPFTAFITTPCQVWSRCGWTYPLPYYSVFTADTLLYAVILTFDLEHLQRIACDVMKLCTKFERNRAIRGGAIAISLFDHRPLFDLEHCVTCCTRRLDNFHQVWPSTTYPCLNFSVLWCWYVMSRSDIEAWPSTRWLWKFVEHQASRDHSLYEICTKSSNTRLNYW